MNRRWGRRSWLAPPSLDQRKRPAGVTAGSICGQRASASSIRSTSRRAPPSGSSSRRRSTSSVDDPPPSRSCRAVSTLQVRNNPLRSQPQPDRLYKSILTYDIVGEAASKENRSCRALRARRTKASVGPRHIQARQRTREHRTKGEKTKKHPDFTTLSGTADLSCAARGESGLRVFCRSSPRIRIG
jgi:hypothetical protein